MTRFYGMACLCRGQPHNHPNPFNTTAFERAIELPLGVAR